jgi:hypothetical protein
MIIPIIVDIIVMDIVSARAQCAMLFLVDIHAPIIDNWMLTYRTFSCAFFFGMTFRTEAMIAARSAGTMLTNATICSI